MKKNDGFTLIEVLIALAILSIALITIIRVTGQNIRDNVYLQTKTIATWVGLNVINQVRVGQLKLPEGLDGLDGEMGMLNHKWSWKGNLTPTPNVHIKEIKIVVFEEPSHEKITELNSYLYVKTALT